MLCVSFQALCIISKPLVNSKWSYSPETFNPGQNWWFFVLCDLEIWWMTWKTIGHLFYASLQPPVNSNWSYSSETPNLGPNRRFFCAVWPWNLMDDLEKQQATSPMRHQALCIVALPYVNSNWSYSPETVKLGFDVFEVIFDLWPGPFSWTWTSFNGNNSWKFHDDMIRWM